MNKFKNLREKRGFYCAVRGCRSKPNGTVSFFYFPKDKCRCIVWLKQCDRMELADREMAFLIKNRVCAKHFTDDMFLNELKNRLQPHALPILNLPNTEQENLPPPSPNKIMPTSSLLENMPSTSLQKNMPSISLMENMPSTSHQECAFSINRLKSSVSTQTDKLLSEHSPRKEKLRQINKTLKTENTQLGKLQRNSTLEDFKELCYKFLPVTTAKLVESQAILNTQKPKGRKFSIEFKRFALQLYFLSPRAYLFVRKTLILPTIRSLQRIK